VKLTKEERDLRDSLERGEWQRVAEFEQERKRLQSAANVTLNEDATISIRMSRQDMDQLKRIAEAEGLSCEAYVCNLLHTNMRE